MVARKLLLEDEEVVHVVEDTVEVARQQIWLNYLDHLGVAVPVDVEQVALLDSREQLWLVFAVFREDLLKMLDLHKHGQVRVQTSLLEQIVVRLLQVDTGEIVLGEFGRREQEGGRHVELDTAFGGLFVAEEEEVRDYFELDESFVRVEHLEFFGVAVFVGLDGGDNESIYFPVVALKVNLLLINS